MTNLTPREIINSIQKKIENAKLLLAATQDPQEKKHWQKVIKDHQKLIKQYAI